MIALFIDLSRKPESLKARNNTRKLKRWFDIYLCLQNNLAIFLIVLDDFVNFGQV